MNKLTQRDRFLLVFISIVAALFLLINYGYRPMLTEIFANQDTIAKLEEQEKAAQMKVDLLPSVESSVEAATANLATASARYYPWMESYEIERMLTMDALSYDLETLDQIIQMPQLDKFVTLRPYFASTLNALAVDETQTLQKRPECEVLGLFAASVQFHVRGDGADLQRFLDRLLCEMPSIRVTSFEWSKVEYLLAGYSVDALDIQMEVYLCAPANLVITLPKVETEVSEDPAAPEGSGGSKRDDLMDDYL